MSFQPIAITPPYIYQEEARHIEAALNDGFTRVHIRKPEASAEELSGLLSDIPQHLRSKISIHDHHELAETFGIGGIHLNSRNPKVQEGWKGVLSCSTHSPEEARNALDRKFDYIFLSPFFESYSKPGYEPKFSLKDLSGLDKSKIIALGGIDRGMLSMFKDSGFGGIAMLSRAWPNKFEDAFRNFGLQFITHPKPNLDVVEQCSMALEGGCRWIQLRHKDAKTDTLIEEGRAIAELCRKYDATFIIDDHVDLVRTVGADGVHLGKNDMPVDDARRILGPAYIIGATANRYEDVEAATFASADYAGVGPFRFTTTKEKLAPVLGLQGYIEIRDRRMNSPYLKNGHCLPIVAIGGITADDITDIMNAWVNGVAVSGAILNAPDPVTATKTIIDKIKSFKIPF